MKKLFFYAVLLLLCNFIYGQGAIEKKRSISDKVFFGGGIGFQFWTYTGIEVAPVVGYKPLDNLYTGLRLSYQYIGGSSLNFSQNVIGGSLFAQYILFNHIIAHAEYESVLVTTNYDVGGSYDYWANSPLLGGGLYQKLGPRSAMLLLALFNVSASSNSIYSNPIIRISFIF